MTGSWSPGSFALPAGTVTFLLTDVESSTKMWELESAAMADAIARHYELLDAAISSHDGVRPLEQGEGDSVVAAFSRASDAVLAALDAQRDLFAEPWPTAGPLRVRMAVHTGEARLRDERNYAGQAVIRTARLRAIAHGGQVVISSAARDLVTDHLGDDVTLVDLGVHRLKDLARPEHVWQLAHADLAADFPPLRSLDAVPNNLPVTLSSFIGRFDDIGTVVGLLDDNRLITLTGSGGAGKTRLAQQVAAEVAERYPDGAWWVELVGLTNAALVPSAISRATMVPEDPGDPLVGIADRLSDKSMLLVLDNCEHLLDGCAEVAAALLASCSDVTVLATSRAPLNVPGELSWRVPPLALPVRGAGHEPVAALSQYDAVRLFADRAIKGRQNFRLHDDNAATVAEICARLDGIPLAIELAAARCRVLTPAQILDGLGNTIGMLAGGPRVVLPRHQTIEASIAWSYSLLSEAEQLLLQRLAIFASAFSLDAAEAVVPDEQLPMVQVLDLLEHLVDQSLVQMDDTSAEARFRMLETVRQFARRELERAAEVEALAARHATYFAARARTLWPLFHEGMTALLDRADEELDDLVAMLDYLGRNATTEEYGEVAAACLPAIGIRLPAVAADLAAPVFSRIDDAPSAVAGRLHLELAMINLDMASIEWHREAAARIAQVTGDQEVAAGSAFWEAYIAALEDPTRERLDALIDTSSRLHSMGDGRHMATLPLWVGSALLSGVGRHEEASDLWELARSQIVCERCSVGLWAEGALLELARGAVDSARSALRRAEELAVQVRDPMFTAWADIARTELAAYTGEPWRRTDLEAQLGHALAHSSPMTAGFVQEGLALGYLVDGDFDAAERHLIGPSVGEESFAFHRLDAMVRRAGARHALGEQRGAREILEAAEEHADRWDAGPLLRSRIGRRAAALNLDGDAVGEAEERAHAALADAASGPFPSEVIGALELLSSTAVARESWTEAARLHGAAERLRDSYTFRLRLEPERSRLDRDLGAAREAIGDEAFEGARNEGSTLSLDDAVAYARRTRGERKRPSHGWDGLTPTERRVADLALQGLSNAEIAQQLIVGRETVKTHLSNVYAKVGVANRTQLAADAAKRGITPAERNPT